MFRRVQEVKWKQFETFLFAGFCYAWVALLLEVTERVQVNEGVQNLSTNLLPAQLGFLAITIAILFYIHRLLKFNTTQNLLMAFFAALFFAVWEPLYVIVAMVALSTVYAPRKIRGKKIPFFIQPAFSLILITYIYLDGTARAAIGLAPVAGTALQLISLAILIELTVVYTWFNGTGKGPEIIK